MVRLGKRMGVGWYTGNRGLDKTLDSFFDWIEQHHFSTMDELELLIEHSERVESQPSVRADWKFEDFQIHTADPSTS